MGIIQNNPQFNDRAQFYTIGLNKTVLIVGLGNKGSKYNQTRHNIGFECIDAYAKSNDFPQWIEKRDLKSLVAIKTLGDTRVIMIKPTTMMNLSGEAISSVVHFYKITPTNIVAVHDELDIDFGQIRTRIGGSAAGHNGIKSIIQYIGEEFSRVRVGVGPKQPENMDSADFVLQKFNAAEQKQMSALLRETNSIISEYIFGDQVMHQTTRSFIV